MAFKMQKASTTFPRVLVEARSSLGAVLSVGAQRG